MSLREQQFDRAGECENMELCEMEGCGAEADSTFTIRLEDWGRSIHIEVCNAHFKWLKEKKKEYEKWEFLQIATLSFCN